MATNSETLVFVPSNPTARPLPTGPNADDEWTAICRDMDIVPLSAEEAVKLPPWTEDAAAAFEQVIEETFERVDEPASCP